MSWSASFSFVLFKALKWASGFSSRSFWPASFFSILEAGMAHFHRLIFCCVVVLMAWLPASSFASFSPNAYQWRGNYDTTFMSFSSAAQKECQTYFDVNISKGISTSYTGGDQSLSTTAVQCVGSTIGGNGAPFYYYANRTITRSSLICPANSTGTTSCTCITGFNQSGSSCVSVYVTTQSLQTVLDSVNSSGDQYCTTAHQVTTGLVACQSGYAVKGSVFATGSGTNTDGSQVQCIQGPFSGSGADCSGLDSSLADNGTCKSGKVPGMVNGVTVCVTPGTITVSGPSSTASSPSGSASNPTSGLGSNAPPTATSSSQSTQCSDGSCVKTTTFTDATGATVGTASSSVPQASFCADNPSLSICKTSTFSGACGSAPACSGDAVMCAVAAATFATNCKLVSTLTPDDPSTAIGTAAQNGSDGINTDAMKAAAHGSSVAISNFDVTGKGWSRSCPADPVISIPFGTIGTWTLPLSRICSPLQILANAAVGITLLASLVWVIGGRKT